METKTKKNEKIQIDVIQKTCRTIEYYEIERTGFAFYIDTRNIDINGRKSTHQIKGVTSISNIISVKELERIDDNIIAPNMYGGKAEIKVISKDNLQKLQNGTMYVLDAIEEIENKTYPLPENYEFVLWNEASHKIADLYYNFIPIPYHFYYCDGSIENETYDLEKLLKKLKKDNRVLNRDNLKISDIPYYNATEERNKQIDFKYLLTQKEYNEIELMKMDSFDKYRYILSNIAKLDDCKLVDED